MRCTRTEKVPVLQFFNININYFVVKKKNKCIRHVSNFFVVSRPPVTFYSIYKLILKLVFSVSIIKISK